MNSPRVFPRRCNRGRNELKELIRKQAQRGKISLSVSFEKQADIASPVTVNVELARSYHAQLVALRDAVGIREEIGLEAMLRFSDVFTSEEAAGLSEAEWAAATAAVSSAAAMLVAMRSNEGRELTNDLVSRLRVIERALDEIEQRAAGRPEAERVRLQERIAQLLSPGDVDPQRIAMEIAMLADKMDITEEIVRFRSHIKFFDDTLAAPESEGRKLSFLLQEMNREANTITSKSYDAAIAHLVVNIKEELERVREQVQNVE
ncbi:MAG: YicC family protein [Ignavibacteria bacterium]|nr:YicC family protein [Ignavibacteria bacterium]